MPWRIYPFDKENPLISGFFFVAAPGDSIQTIIFKPKEGKKWNSFKHYPSYSIMIR